MSADRKRTRFWREKKNKKNKPRYTVSNQIPKRTCPHWKIQLKKEKEKKTQKIHTPPNIAFVIVFIPTCGESYHVYRSSFLHPAPFSCCSPTICQWWQSEYLLMSLLLAVRHFLHVHQFVSARPRYSLFSRTHLTHALKANVEGCCLFIGTCSMLDSHRPKIRTASWARV